MPQVMSVEIKKQGTGDKGPWTMLKITTEDGKTATGFDPIKVGEYVELKQDGKFTNYTKIDKPIEAPPASVPQSAPLPFHPPPNGLQLTREHLMQAVNLYNLCIDCVSKAVHLPENARTGEQYQATLASIWIEASSRRSTDGVTWWSYIDKMPKTPLK